MESLPGLLGGCRTRALLRYFQRELSGFSWRNVEGHFNVNNLQPALKVLKPRSKPSSRVSDVQTTDDCLMSDMNEPPIDKTPLTLKKIRACGKVKD